MNATISPWIDSFDAFIDLKDPLLSRTALVIALCPLIWNILGRLARALTTAVVLSERARYILCYAMAVWTFSFSIYRDYLYHTTVEAFPTHPLLKAHSNEATILGAVMIVVGQILVLASYYQLGVTGTYLGDYCGILMDEPITAFPFNILANPMYFGSTLTFMGYAVYQCSPVGFLFTAEVLIIYQIALLFEEPYTAWIYSQREVTKTKKTK